MIYFYKWTQIMRFPEQYYSEYAMIMDVVYRNKSPDTPIDEHVEKLMRERGRNRVWWRKNTYGSDSNNTEKTDTSYKKHGIKKTGVPPKKNRGLKKHT